MTESRGTAHGFGWVDCAFKAFPTDLLTPATRGRTGPVRILAVGNPVPDASTLQHWRAKDPYFRNLFSSDIGVRPFDEAEEFPDSPVTYYVNGVVKLDLDALAARTVEIPETIELRLEYLEYKRRLYAYARTLRDGAEAIVRRKVGSRGTFAQEMAPILGYFERNCPRIEDGAERSLVCGEHVNGILSGLTGEGRAHVERWLGRVRAHPIDSSIETTITQAMLTRVPGARKVTLRRPERSGIIQSEVLIEGGHRLVDDEQGTGLELAATLPEAVVSSLKGRRLTQVIEIPWLEPLTVRTARITQEGVTMRAFGPRQAVRLPQHVDDDEATVREHLLLLTQGRDAIEKVDESVSPLLAAMTPRALLAALSLLQSDQRVDMGPFGFPGWRLRRMGGIVQMESCPTAPIADIVARAAEGRGGTAQAIATA